MYEYGNIENAKAGDVVEWVDTTRHSSHNEGGCPMTLHKLYIVTNSIQNRILVTTDVGCTDDTWLKDSFKLVKTKSGTEAKVGDTVIRFKGGTRTCPTGTVFTVLEVGDNSLYYAHNLSAFTSECKVLCKASTAKPEPISTEKRNLAFYKRSGEPWTNQECENIVRYVGSPYQINNKKWGNNRPTCKYWFDDGSKLFYMSDWYTQERQSNFKNCKQVAYEDVFKTPYLEETPRVAIVTKHVNGHPVGSRIVPTDASNCNWKLADGSKSSPYSHNIGSNCEWEDTLTTYTGTVTFTPLDETSSATICSQPTPTIPEEEVMNTNNITIAMTADEYAKYQKSNKPTKPKTQLETAPKWFTLWYGANGHVDCQTTESPKKAKKALQHPSRLGFTFRSYLITESATTDIPVVNVEI